MMYPWQLLLHRSDLQLLGVINPSQNCDEFTNQNEIDTKPTTNGSRSNRSLYDFILNLLEPSLDLESNESRS